MKKIKKHRLEEYTLLNIIELGLKKYPSLVALERYRSDFGRLTFKKLYYYSQSMGAFLVDKNINKGDKVAILGESDPYWGLAYFAIIQAGAIAVPILPDFSGHEIETILAHSEAKAIFLSSNRQYQKVGNFIKENNIELFRIQDAFYIPKNIASDIKTCDDFANAAGIDIRKYNVNKKMLLALQERRVQEEDLASIIYTSGTTGSSKGVMLTHKNIASNVDTATVNYCKIKPKDRMLSILPQSHTYEFSFGFCLSLLCGCKTTYLGKPPTASILLPALKEIKPHIMLSVPLLIEKLYKSAVLGQMEKDPKLKKFFNRRLTHKFICRIIGRKLRVTFGNHLKFFGLGGAPLDKEVEQFLIDSKFPIALGYGLTETSPLVAGCGPKAIKYGVVGFITENVDVRIVDVETNKVLKKNQEGEIQVKGPNVMRGYFKNEELTKEVFTEDNWFKTGDLGFLDRKNRLGIKGRIKTMILGPSGENIYPESIENLINNSNFVEESLVFKKDHGLAALIKVDIKLMADYFKLSIDEAKIEANNYIKNIRKDVNSQLGSYSRIEEVELQEEPLVRTPTMKIKRYLYEKMNKKDKKETKE